MDRLRRARRGRRARSARGAFTLLEVMIALGILALGLLAIAAMQIHAMRGGAHGRFVTQAASIARSQLEVFQRLPFDDAQLAATGGWTAPQAIARVVQANPADQTEQVYNLQWRIADLNAGPTLKAIDVRVTWSEEDRPNRTVTLSTQRFGQ
jgi:type IV pilus assembly protein PilV